MRNLISKEVELKTQILSESELHLVFKPLIIVSVFVLVALSFVFLLQFYRFNVHLIYLSLSKKQKQFSLL